MKVVLATPGIYPIIKYGGVERYYFNLAKFLAFNDIDVIILTSGNRKLLGNFGTISNIKYKFIIDSRIIYGNFPTQIGINLFRNYVNKFLVSNSNFDILHATYAHFPYVILPNRKPVIAQCLGLAYMLIYNFYKKLYSYMNNFVFDKLGYSMSDAIFVEGENQAKELVAIYKLNRKYYNKIHVIPNGVDLRIINKFKKYFSFLEKTSLGFSKDDFIISCVCRLVSNKGLPTLLRAVRELVYNFDFKNIKLIIIGDGPEKNKLLRYVYKYNIQNQFVYFKNASEYTKYKLLAISDVFVFPSLYEGLPTAILEAMGMGLPVIASDIDDIANAIKNGINGFLVTPGSYNEIAEKIIYMYDNDLSKTMGKKSLTIIKRFDWAVLIKNIIKIYYSLIR